MMTMIQALLPVTDVEDGDDDLFADNVDNWTFM